MRSTCCRTLSREATPARALQSWCAASTGSASLRARVVTCRRHGTSPASPSTTPPSAGGTCTCGSTLTANPTGGISGYGIVPVTAGTGSTFGGNTGALLAYTATMTAPAAAGTYSYTVWTNQGPTSAGNVGSAVYSITVAPPPTTPPPTTPPPTTPAVTIAPIHVGEDSLSPASALGLSHLSMYNLKGANCANCHDGSFVPAPPRITGEDINMQPGISCAACHNARGEEDPLFISLMNNPTKVVYKRCSDCHVVVSYRDTWDD